MLKIKYMLQDPLYYYMGPENRDNAYFTLVASTGMLRLRKRLDSLHSTDLQVRAWLNMEKA